MLKAIFNFVGKDIQVSRFLDIKNDALHFFMYLIHNCAFFIYLVASLLIIFDVYQNNGNFIKYILADKDVLYLESSEIENKSILILYYFALPMSILVSVIGGVCYLLNKKKIEHERYISTKISSRIFPAFFYFILGFLYPALTYLGGGVLVFKILGLLSDQQALWLLLVKILILSKVFALMTAQVSANVVQLFLGIKMGDVNV